MAAQLHPVKLFVLIIVVLLVPSVVAVAQTNDGDGVITDDEVNDIAQKLYCPVCENIPLDACGTAACDDWRYEIRIQLEAGMTEAQIIDDFVYRFGDRVVGTPQSTAPRLLSLVTPWIAIALGLVISFQFWRNRRDTDDSIAADDAPNTNISAYRDLLENDVSG